MNSSAPVLVERVRVYPFGFDNNVMDNNEFEVDEIQVGGGFFDDDPLMATGRAGRPDIRSHLDDLAHRHPEFADSLRGPPWASEMRGGWGRNRTASGSGGEEAAASSGAASSAAASSASAPPPEQQEQADEPGPLRGRARNNLPQHGLRNTVPDMGQRQAQEEEAERGQRSWSAPPDSRAAPPQPQRFVSRLDINPVNPAEEPAQPAGTNTSQESRPPPAPPRPTPKPSGNVRHIPIFVEGRDEPVVPKPEPSQFTSQTQHNFQPARPAPQQKRPYQAQPNTEQKHPSRSFNTSPRPFQSTKSEPEMPENPPVQEEPVEEPPRQEPPPKVVVDPISKVQAIQSEVTILKLDVEKYSGNSRKDKDYVYIDEMLTRNLLKLDDIETEGRDDIRQARKAAIRSIQACINELEAKVPLPPDQAVEVASKEGEGMEVALCEPEHPEQAAGGIQSEGAQPETS